MSRKVLDTERPFHIEQYLQVLAQSEDPPDILNDVTQLWMSDGTDSGDSGDLYFKIHIGGDPGQNASHKLMDFAGNVFADGYMFADKAIAGGNVAVADGIIALDLTLGSNFTNTPSQNTVWTTVAPTNGIGGERCSFVVNNSGGFAVSWSTGFTNVDAIGAGDTGVHVRTLQFDGTTWHQIAATLDGEAINVTGGTGVFREIATGNIFGPTAAGRDALTGDYNFAAVDGAGDALTSGRENVLIGRDAGTDLTEGHQNVFIGDGAGANETTGDDNVAIGTNAYWLATTASENVAIGPNALGGTVGGWGNIAIGPGAIFGDFSTSMPSQNIGIGASTLLDITSGTVNIAVGHRSLTNLTTADDNIGIGRDCLFSISIGDDNIGIGFDAGSAFAGDTNKCISIGYQSGPVSVATYSEELFIDTHADDTPLIYADFAAHTVDINGTLSKTAGSFKINHPLDDSKNLYHGFIEGAEYGLLYRGVAVLANGTITVNIDRTCGMSPGTFEAIAQNPTIQVQNMTGFISVRPTEITGADFTIETPNTNSGDTVNWVVYAERKDKFIMESSLTDNNGRLILEVPKKHRDGRNVTPLEAKKQISEKDERHRVRHVEQDRSEDRIRIKSNNRDYV